MYGVWVGRWLIDPNWHKGAPKIIILVELMSYIVMKGEVKHNQPKYMSWAYWKPHSERSHDCLNYLEVISNSVQLHSRYWFNQIASQGNFPRQVCVNTEDILNNCDATSIPWHRVSGTNVAADVFINDNVFPRSNSEPFCFSLCICWEGLMYF